MKKLMIILLIVSVVSLNTTVFAVEANQLIDSNDSDEESKEDFEYKLKDGYYFKDGEIYSYTKIKDDNYLKSLKFLMKYGKIKIDNNGIIKLIDGKNNVNFYKECILETGEFYGIIPKEQLKVFEGDSDYNLNELRAEIFDYYGECRNHIIELMFLFSTHHNMGLSVPLAWLETAKEFVNKERSNGEWDYKVFLGVDTIYYTGFGYYDGEAIGNMHYGTVGSFLFYPQTLLVAAGIYQLIGGNWDPSWFSTYFDDPSDQNAIKKGIKIHKSKNYPTIRDYGN